VVVQAADRATEDRLLVVDGNDDVDTRPRGVAGA
jgi:hypothetical protein